MTKRDIKFAAVILLMLCVFRLGLLIPTTHKYQFGIFRMGMQPVNDALLWLDCSKDILESRPAPGRPMLPIVLSILGQLFHNNFNAYAAFFILINALGLLLAFYILKDIRNNIFIVAFLALISMWNAPFEFSIATEVLARPFLVAAFALVIRAMYYSSYDCLFLAFFSIALAQSIRPWDFFSLATLPLFPLALRGLSKKTAVLTGVGIASILLGVSFCLMASRLFCTADSDMVFAMRVWAQAHRGTGIYQAYMDKDMALAALDNQPPERLAEILFRNSWREVKKHPQNLIEAFTWTFAVFFRDLSISFSRQKIGNILYCLMMFFVLFFYFYDRERIRGIFASSSKKIWPVLVFIALLAAIIWKPETALLYLAGLGLFFLLIFASKAQRVFTLLYLAGICVSLLFNGGSGGEREWMSMESLLYYFSAWGLYYICGGFKKRKTPESDFNFNYKKFVPALSIVFSCLAAVFLLIPLFMRAASASHNPEPPLTVNNETIRRQFNLGDTALIGPLEFEFLLIKWPTPSFEEATKSFCYTTLRYRSYHALNFIANEGTGRGSTNYWPLSPMPIARTVYIENRIIFPELTKEKLSRFEGKEIVVFGQLLGKPRASFTDAGYAIIALNIGYIGDNGKLTWIDIKELQTS